MQLVIQLSPIIKCPNFTLKNIGSTPFIKKKS